MKNRKLKTSVKLFIFGIIVIIISFIVGSNIIKDNNYKKTYKYKLETIGYEIEEITDIEKLDNNQIDYILTLDYSSIIPKLLNEKYFIYNNLDSYLTYYIDNSELGLSNTVTMVNVNRDHEYYDEDFIKSTDLNDGTLILVNKYNRLSEDFLPDDLTPISLQYAYSGHQLIEVAAEAFTNMAKAAEKDGEKLIAVSTYRTYDRQEFLWESRADASGIESADSQTARPGHSEHQSGLAVDITTNSVGLDGFVATDEYQWLILNCYKYGFILRYPENKEDITGYEYESWHYRYVGIEIATKINELDITFDEYYAYYIENK